MPGSEPRRSGTPKEVRPELDQDLRDPLHLARLCASILDEKKITDLEIFDVGESTSLTGFFVIGTGLSPRHLQSSADDLEKAMKDRGVRRLGLEGYRDGKWILLDVGDVVIHLFLEEARSFYDLELLWGDAPRVDPGIGAERAKSAP